MSEKITLKNINTIDTLSLADLPGIGPALAERIIGNRPYTTIEELLAVKGIGSHSLERLRGLITLEEIEGAVHHLAEEEPIDQASQTDESPTLEETSFQVEIAPFDVFEEPDSFEELEKEMDEKEKVEKGKVEKSEEIGPVEKEAVEKESANLVTRPQARWLAFSGAFLAFILAVALTLGVLTSLNGGLRYASQNQSAALERQITALSSRVDTLTQDIEGLRERVDNLDHLGGRVDELEERLNATEGEIEILSQQLTELQENTNRFQTFLEDLHELLNDLFQSEEAQ